MTARSDSTPLIAGRALSSRYGGFGIRGADAPLAGEHGPGLIGPAVTLPAENDDEFRAEIITIPGTLTYSRFFEDGTTEAEGPDGVHSGTWRLRKNNAIVGPDPQTYTFVFGPPPELSGDSALGDLVSTGGIDAPNALTGASALDDLLASGSIDAPNSLAGASQLDDLVGGGSIVSAAPSSLTGTAALDVIVASGAIDAPNSLAGTSVLGDLQATGAVSSVFPSDFSGTAQLADLVASGEIVSVPSSTLTGAAALEAIVGAGGIDAPNLLGGTSVLGDLVGSGSVDSIFPSDLSGVAQLADLQADGFVFGGCTLLGQAAFDAITAAGEVAGITTPEVLDMYILLAPDDQIINVGGVASKDPEGKVWLGFQFKRYTTLPTAPEITITRERGAPDPDPAAVLSGTPIIIGTLVLQQVQGGVPYCDYLVRCEATGTDGSRYVMAGVLPVRPAH